MNSQEVLQLIGLTKARYQAKFQHNAAVEEVWNMVLDDVPFEPAKVALAQWIKTKDWPPDPATDIRGRVLQETSGLPTPSEAWLMVLHRMKSTYHGQPAPDWDVPREVRAALDDIGGMYLLRQVEKADDARKRYERAYADRLDRARTTPPALGPDVMKELLG